MAHIGSLGALSRHLAAKDEEAAFPQMYADRERCLMAIPTTLFSFIANALLTQSSFRVGAYHVDVRTIPERAGSSGHPPLKAATFHHEGRRFTAIEQNPNRPSEWAEKARNGHKVVQFKDDATQKYVAVAVDGEVEIYP